MALIKCKECGKEFSDMANACPNCGCCQVKFVAQSERKSKITAGFLSLFFCFLGAHELYLGNLANAIYWIICGIIIQIIYICIVFFLFTQNLFNPYYESIFYCIYLIPIFVAIRLWCMPKEKFDLKYNQVGSPKKKTGCLIILALLLILHIWVVINIISSIYQANRIGN